MSRDVECLLAPGVEQFHANIIYIADIPADQGQFVHYRSCGEECIDNRP